MIYMDNAATSWPKPEVVYRAMDTYMREGAGNPGRSAHEFSITSGRVIYETRDALARLFGVGDPLRIVFTKNTTESLNLVVKGLLDPGDHVVTSAMEHNSVMRPLRALENRGVELTIVRCSHEGFLDPRDVEQSIRSNTKLIVMNHASNVIGTLLPVEEVGHIAQDHGVLFCVDAAQTAGTYPIDIGTMNVDMLAFTGHKSLLGPQGTGGLYVREGVESMLDPLLEGGTGSHSEYEYQPDFLPDKYESGTLNGAGLAGLGAGVEFVLSDGVAKIRAQEERLTSLLIEGLSGIPGTMVYGSGDARKQTAVVSFNIVDMTPSEVAMELEEAHHVMCRAGLQCAPIAHKSIDTFPRGTVRLSPGYFNTDDEIKWTVRAISRIAKKGS